MRICSLVAVLVLGWIWGPARSDGPAGPQTRYKALLCDLPPASGTWAILDRDGANRQVEPYLSSLAQGEFGTGTVTSPAFSIEVERITFTICGHDGQGGGEQKNFIALVDGRSGYTLRRTVAPGSDPLQPRSWDVGDIAGRKVRIQIRDGIASGAFAWLGVGEIDAGPQLRVDFRKGMPEGWEVSQIPREARTEPIQGGIPFLALRETLIPTRGAVEIPCGFAARRLFVLGCTVFRGKPLETHGTIEIHYRSGPPGRIPLMIGYTLEGQFKLLSRSKAMHLHPSGDPFQYYLVLAPRDEVIERIRLEGNPDHPGAPWITAITCETQATAENLKPLPDSRPGPEEEAWIRAHTISPDSPRMEEIEKEIRRAHHM